MKKAIVIIFHLLLSNSFFSQQIMVTRDFGIWGGVNIEKKLSKEIEINLGQQLRYYSDATSFDDYIIDFGGKYKMNKNFKLGANLRFTHDAKRWKEAENNYRYNLDLNYKANISKKIKLYYRLRYQETYVDLFSEYQTTNIHYSGFRNKIKIKYNLNKRNKLFLSGELFRLKETFRSPYFNKIRFYLGDEIKTKIGNVSCSFGYEQEINTDYPLSFFFIRLAYTIKL